MTNDIITLDLSTATLEDIRSFLSANTGNKYTVRPVQNKRGFELGLFRTCDMFDGEAIIEDSFVAGATKTLMVVKDGKKSVRVTIL